MRKAARFYPRLAGMSRQICTWFCECIFGGDRSRLDTRDRKPAAIGKGTEAPGVSDTRATHTVQRVFLPPSIRASSRGSIMYPGTAAIIGKSGAYRGQEPRIYVVTRLVPMGMQ